MNIRLPLIVAMCAGLPATSPGQELFSVSYSWLEVVSGTTVQPTVNSVLDPGESARIRVGVTALFNGTSAIGQTTAYAIPAPGGIGTVRGLGSVVYDLIGDNNAATASGTWGGFIGGLQGPQPSGPFSQGLSSGSIQPGGASVHGYGGLQFVPPGGSANAANSIVQVFRSVWRPNSYSPRSVTFRARASILVPTGEHNSVLFAYGFGTDPNTGSVFDLFDLKYISTDFDVGITIPIAPAPSTLALLFAPAAFGRRRPPLAGTKPC